MALVDCDRDDEWAAYVERNPAVWGFGHLRPAGKHLLPLFREPPAGSLKVVLAGPPASGKTTVAKLFGLPKAFEEPVGEWVSFGPDKANVLFARKDIPHGLKQLYLSSTTVPRVICDESAIVERSPIDAWGIFLRFNPPGMPAAWADREDFFGNAFERDATKITAINDLTMMMSATRVVVVYMRSSPEKSHARRLARGHPTDQVSLEEHAALVEAHEKFYNSGIRYGFEVKIVDTRNAAGHDHVDTKAMIESIIGA